MIRPIYTEASYLCNPMWIIKSLEAYADFLEAELSRMQRAVELCPKRTFFVNKDEFAKVLRMYDATSPVIAYQDHNQRDEVGGIIPTGGG